MLQQTQAPRVVPKYKSWIKKFPTFKAVADASTREVLEEWKGLGYNRRALAFKRLSEKVTTEFKGKLPRDYKTLLSLPGIGTYTAHAVRAFAWNEPEIFIETNIRSVFIHHFFPNDGMIHDKELFPLIEKTLDSENPREWYYALMDYGSFLKRNGNPSQKSSHYVKQSSFKGSNREQRSLILQFVLENKKVKENRIKDFLLEKEKLTEKFKSNLEALLLEGFLEKKRDFYEVKR